MLMPGSEICGLPIAAILLAALILDALVGDLPRFFAVVHHPVAIVGRAIAFLDRRLNRPGRGRRALIVRGTLVAAILAVAAIGFGWLVAHAVRGPLCGWWIEGPVVAMLLAQRSLFDHVRAVSHALAQDGLDAGRDAVAHIVGRDPARLDRHGVARAAIESLAENFSDAVVAPVLFYLLFGLPGLFLYKTVNTLDSMIGHRNGTYEAFGKFAARLDDLLNIVPARVSGIIIAAAAIFTPGGRPARALMVMVRDARKSPSPNAGWPEAAMSGAIGVALLGPRRYGGTVANDPWIGGQFPARAVPRDIRRALFLYAVACFLLFAAVAVILSRTLTG